jgi:CheY-like chemotaxis protein
MHLPVVPGPKPEVKSARNKILVVDDEPMVCQTIKMLLEFDGHEVVTAPDADNALVLFGKDRFDLVITDYTMPGMKGDALAVALKALLPSQPVIMITAHAEMLKAQAAPLAGVDQLVGKPFQISELRDAIQRASAG